MGSRRAISVLVMLSLVSMTAACGQEENVNAPSASDFTKEREKLANRKDDTKQQAKGRKGRGREVAKSKGSKDGTAYAAGGQDYFYDPRGKRDPFRSFQFADVDAEEGNPEESFGPLGDFELGQLELTAVIWDATNPRALVLDPGGRAYIVREGSQIGKNGGQVIHIGDNLILVKETYENFAGERTTKDVELRIRLSQGG